MENLVYCCFYCNNAKSNKWKNNNGFIDPCTNEYNLHLCRNSRGQIKHRTYKVDIFMKFELRIKTP